MVLLLGFFDHVVGFDDLEKLQHLKVVLVTDDVAVAVFGSSAAAEESLQRQNGGTFQAFGKLMGHDVFGAITGPCIDQCFLSFDLELLSVGDVEFPYNF